MTKLKGHDEEIHSLNWMIHDMTETSERFLLSLLLVLLMLGMEAPSQERPRETRRYILGRYLLHTAIPIIVIFHSDHNHYFSIRFYHTLDQRHFTYGCRDCF